MRVKRWFFLVMLGLHQRTTGEGQHIDVSMLEAVVSTPPNFIHQYSFTGVIAGRGAFLIWSAVFA